MDKKTCCYEKFDKEEKIFLLRISGFPRLIGSTKVKFYWDNDLGEWCYKPRWHTFCMGTRLTTVELKELLKISKELNEKKKD